MSEQEKQQAEQPTETQEEVTSEIVELEWQEVSQIFKLREELSNIEAHFSTMCLNFEKRKAELIGTISEYEKALYGAARSLSSEKGISQELTYELKLPASEGEKGYFIRKQQ